MFSQLAIALSITKGGKWVIRYWFMRFVGINFFVTIALGACCFLGRRGSIAGCGDLANSTGSTLIIFRILACGRILDTAANFTRISLDISDSPNLAGLKRPFSKKSLSHPLR